MIASRLKTPLVITVFALIAVWILFGRSTDEQVTHRILENLVDAANRAPKAPIFEQLSIVKVAGKNFSSQISGTLRNGAEVREFSLTRKEAEDRAVAAAKNSWRELEIKISDIAVHAERPTAEAKLELHIFGALEGVEGKFYEHWALTIRFNHSSGEWLIERVDGINLRAST